MPSRSTPHAPGAPKKTAAYFSFTKLRRKLGIKTIDRGLSTPWHTLRDNSGFRWYFLGSVTSDFGTWLQNTAQVLLAYQLAHSVLTVGLVTFLIWAGWILILTVLLLTRDVAAVALQHRVGQSFSAVVTVEISR